MERIENSHNCSFSYRYRLYQYIWTSATSNLPFSIFAVICTGKKITIKNKNKILIIELIFLLEDGLKFYLWVLLLLYSLSLTFIMI